VAKITERPVEPHILEGIKTCAKDAIGLLGFDPQKVEPRKVIEALDQFVYQWQKGKRLPPDVLGEEDAPFTFGSLWGLLWCRRFKWEWAHVTFHEHGDTVAHGVFSPDRALAIYPIHFLMGCMPNRGVDCTIALAYNMLSAGKIGETKPGEYFNLMDGVHRIVPRL
jgi:hypothetical protein